MIFWEYPIPLVNTKPGVTPMSVTAAPWFNASRLKTRQLLLLLHLHEQRSVLRAAEAASMTQPAASKLLAEMEDMLGVKLFERHARGVEPTWYGQVLIRRARAAMSEIGRAQEEIAALRSGRMGQATIGTVVYPGTTLVPQAITEVKREFPDILVRVEMDYSRPLVTKLLDGQLDLVVGRILGSQGVDELEFEPLAEEPHSAVARAGHPLASRAGLQHADLLRYGWVLPPVDSVLRTRLDTMFIERGLHLPSNVIETSSLPITSNLLRGSDLLAALPVDALAPLIQTKLLTVLPIELGVRLESFGIIRRRDYVLPPGAERMLQALRTTARRLYPGQRSRP
jgi:DNA-binding transcriptional LysR family regulator